ncbi:hypothetical protein LOTGIDRAFT_171770 [Lottia gigantea]|uniref:Uncharacterized protein n=1 Tax=Lottia gigantea TaxID=225164 RepID=V4CKC6_LOTGI|nr:hypothetical protein LOTGIDRAFT_171770 [Lottia gigantea]ESP02695.1 hypothetical protein LOTGIDRAFT_171770 [Lottia gigantea]
MLNWIKKRCRRKSAPSAREAKIKSHQSLFDVKTDTVDHDYEEIDDIISPDQLAYAIVTLTDKITMESVDKLPIETICPVCRRKQVKGDLVCFCSVLNSNQISDDDYDEVDEISCSTPIESKSKPKRRQPDFSKRPLPEIPQEGKPVSENPLKKLKNFPELSYSDDSNSSSSGYFDSCISQSESSSDDSLSFEFQKMILRQRSKEVFNRQRSQPSVRQHSPPRPRMGCRALSRTQNMRRCRSSSRANGARFNVIREPITRQVPKVYENVPTSESRSRTIGRAASSRLPCSNTQFQRQTFHRQVRSQVRLYENV